MRSALPLRDGLPVTEEMNNDGLILSRTANWPETWKNYFNALARAIIWNKSLAGTKTHDFGSILAHTESSTTVTIEGARTDLAPIVTVTPSINTAGIVYKGVVTAIDTVTIYALNTTALAIDPAETVFRVLVLQP